MRLAAALSSLALIAGCDTMSAPADARKAFNQRAALIAKAWEASAAATTIRKGLTLLSIQTWRPYVDAPLDPIDENIRQTILAGRFVLHIPKQAPPEPGTVTFADGGTMTVPLVTVYDAYKQLLVPTPTCFPHEPHCVMLTITGARLTTRHLLTGRGEADVPVWRFTVAGLAKTVDQVAVAPAALTPVPPEVLGLTDPLASPRSARAGPAPDDRGPEFTGGDSLQAAAGTSLTFRTFSTEACSTVSGPLVYEDARTVVLGATVKRAPPGTSCALSLTVTRYSVTLAAPIGDRVVLDVVKGSPLFVRESLW